MKKLIYSLLALACVLTLTATFTACNNNVSTDKLLYRNWAESDIETFTYDITKDNASVGTVTQTIKPVDGGYQIDYNQVMANGDSVVAGVKFKNSSAGSAFLPVESTRTQTINGVVKTQKVVYDGATATCYTENAATISDAATVTGAEISAPYYDNLQFYTILRGATYNNKFSLSFNTFVPNESKVVKISCTLGTAENLTYKVSGTETAVSCQLISLARTDTKSTQAFKAYYATSDIAASGTAVKHALVKYVEGDYTYSLTDIAVTIVAK